jgi:hypothetical protein
MISIGMFALLAIEARAPARPPVFACSKTSASLQEPPGKVCLLADATGQQIHTPILSCPARQTA